MSAMNGPISTTTDASGIVVLGVAAGVELERRLSKCPSRTVSSSPQAPVADVKCTGHIVANIPGSYHGQDSSSWQRLPFRSSRGGERVVSIEYVTRTTAEERRME